VKWSTAVNKVSDLAQSCAGSAALLATINGLRVTQLWAVGDVLGREREIEFVTLVLCVDLPVAEVPWWSTPPGGEAWANSTRMSKNPILPWWRSAHAPVWNHRIERPLLIWDEASGVDGAALEALREGRGWAAGLAEPTPQELAVRLEQEAEASLAALRVRSETFQEKRWGRGRLEAIADPLARVVEGYLDILDAQARLRSQSRH